MWFLLALSAAFFYSMLWILGRMSRGIPSAVVTAFQFSYGPVLLLLTYRTVDFPWGEIWWWAYLTLPFFITPMMAWAMTYALHRTEVTFIKPLFGLSSISALLVATTFFDEQVTTYGVLGIFLIVAGLLSLYHGRWEPWGTRGPWIALFGALFFGANAATVAAVLHRFPHVLALSGLVITGHLIALSIPAIPSLKRVQWNKRTVLILCGLCLALLGQDLSTMFAFLIGPSPYVVAIKRTSLLLTAVIGYVFLHERDQSLSRLLLASILVVTGVILLTVG